MFGQRLTHETHKIYDQYWEKDECLEYFILVLSKGTDAKADIYLIDEPSAYLDVEQRVVAARVMKRLVTGGSLRVGVVE